MADRKIDRTIKGGRKTFFDDPAIDQVLSMLLELLQEHWVLRERVLSLETLMAQNGAVTAEQLDAFEPDDALAAEWDADRAALVARVLASIETTRKS
jgi:hypothetical protein